MVKSSHFNEVMSDLDFWLHLLGLRHRVGLGCAGDEGEFSDLVVTVKHPLVLLNQLLAQLLCQWAVTHSCLNLPTTIDKRHLYLVALLRFWLGDVLALWSQRTSEVGVGDDDLPLATLIKVDEGSSAIGGDEGHAAGTKLRVHHTVALD